MKPTKRVYVSDDGVAFCPEDQEPRTIYDASDGSKAYHGVDIPIPYDTPANEAREWVKANWEWVRSQLAQGRE